MRDTLRDSMSELMQFANNEPNKVTVRKYTLNNLPEYNPSAIKTVRNKTQMTQKVFSDLLGVSVRTVEAWETGKSHPNGSARRLLQLIEQKPEMVEEIEYAAAKG
jgi:putative transcriptional regulator